MSTKRISYQLVREALPDKYPTHTHDASFWEILGRTVATFGFLEEILARAIFSFTATKPYSDEEIERAYQKWIPLLRKALSDPLSNLIKTYETAVKEHPEATILNLDDLIKDLSDASNIRNALCHGSWRPPNAAGASALLYIDRKLGKFDTPVDVDYLKRVQKHTVNLACEVIDTVLRMGWQFPGSGGVGEVIVKNRPSKTAGEV